MLLIFSVLLVILQLNFSAVDANVQCYVCTACSNSLVASENSISSSCVYCGKTKSSNSASRTCLDRCTASVDSDGNGLYCCGNKDLCNSAQRTVGPATPALLASIVAGAAARALLRLR